MTSMKHSEREYIYHAGYPADWVCRICYGTARVKRAGAATLLGPDDFNEDAEFLTGADWASDEFGDGAATGEGKDTYFDTYFTPDAKRSFNLSLAGS